MRAIQILCSVMVCFFSNVTVYIHVLYGVKVNPKHNPMYIYWVRVNPNPNPVYNHILNTYTGVSIFHNSYEWKGRGSPNKINDSILIMEILHMKKGHGEWAIPLKWQRLTATNCSPFLNHLINKTITITIHIYEVKHMEWNQKMCESIWLVAMHIHLGTLKEVSSSLLLMQGA